MHTSWFKSHLNELPKPQRLLGVLSMLLLLSGCFEAGETQGSNLIVVSGSLLKGSTRNAAIKIYDSQNRVVWQGQSDDQGNYNAELSAIQSQLFTIVARITPDSSMICDASECIAPISQRVFSFGESMPGGELGNIQLKTTVYLDAPSDSIQVRHSNQQLNSLSTIVVDVMADELSAELSKQDYNQVIAAANEVVVSSLGMADIDGSANLLTMELPDITEENATSQVSDNVATFGVINASQSSSLNRWDEFSDALVTLKNEPEDIQARTVVNQVQQQVMQEARIMIDDPELNIENQAVSDNVNELLETGVDFSELEQTISDLNVVEEQVTSTNHAIAFAASSYQYGGAPERGSAEPLNQWWWVSSADSQNHKWIELEYPQAFTPVKVEIGMSQRFSGNATRLQASSNGTTWIELAELDQIGANQTSIDQRRVKHLSFSLNVDNSYQHYRLFAQPGEQIWLEYLCLSQASHAPRPTHRPEQPSHCLNNQVPSHAQVSGYALAADRLADPNNNTWWISQLGSDQPQWVAIKYQRAFIASIASITVKQHNQGQSPQIQGSNDGIDWIDITSISTDPYPAELIDSKGFRQFDLPLNNSQSYQYYRYYAEPSSFLWLAYLNFSAG